MTTLKTGEAARVLNVSTHALRSWERRYGWPPSTRTEGNQRRFDAADIYRLKDSLDQTLTISSAVEQAQSTAEISTCCPKCGAPITYVNVRMAARP